MAKHTDFELNIFHARLTKEPEMRYTPSGKAVTTVSVAHNRVWKNADETYSESVIFMRLTAWGKQAEVVNQYLKKGQKYQFTYRLEPDKSGENKGGPRLWDRNDGSKGASFEGTLLTFEFLGSGNGVIAEDGAPMDTGEGGVEGPDNEEDIPF